MAFYTCARVINQYNLMPGYRQWRCAAGKVTMGLHWRCILDFSGLNIYGLKPIKDRWAYAPMEYVTLYFHLFKLPH